MYFRRVVITDNGVYHPLALMPRLVLYVLGLLTVAVAALAGRLTPTSALLYFTLLGVPFAWALYNYRKHGALGRPSVSLSAGVVSIDRPQRAHGMVSFPVAELEELLIYGYRGRRAYRFIRRDGGVEEVVPLWGRKIELGVIEFLLDRLPPAVKVTVEEPQSLFSAREGKPG